jgi:hypothetical protein
MTNRKCVLILIVSVLVLKCSVWVLLRPSRDPWVQAYSRIELGMTRQEVDIAIGLPPGYYEGEYPKPRSMGRILVTPPLRQSGVDFDKGLGVNNGHELQTWIGREYVIWVLFDERGTAVGTYLLQPYPQPRRMPTFIQKVRLILGA